MYTRSLQPTRSGTWRLAAILGALLLLILLVGAQGASAEGVVNVACMNTTPCTANDVRISNMTVLNTPACLDDPNDATTDLFADVQVEAQILTTATARYDVGLWVALAGGSANFGPGNQCYHGILRPLETAGTPFTNNGPYRDLDADYCGDTLQNDGYIYHELQTLHIKCTDTSGTGLMDKISTCTSWDNNDKEKCTQVADAIPGTGSKCHCEQTPLTPVVISQIVVRKVTDPADPAPAFNFTVAGPGLATNPTHFALHNGGSWASGNLPSGGTYSVVEDSPLPTGWIQASVVCTDGVNTYNPTGFTMPANKTVECTFTNAGKAKIIVRKIAEDQNLTPYCPGRVFGFSLTPPTPSTTFSLKSYVCAGAPEAAYVVAPGTYTVGETDPDINVLPDGWLLTNVACTGMTSGWSQNWVAGDKSVTGSLAVGETVICTFTNQQGTPLAVDLQSFGATVSGNSVVVAWTTNSETGTAGFNLYRANSQAGPWTKLNSGLILSDGSNQGSNHTWIDTNVLRGHTYWYLLEDVSNGGASTSHGPVSVKVKGK